MANHPNRSRAVPTETEFRIARELAEKDGPEGEDAYQVCRWFRGQMFLREQAERGLKRIRSAAFGL